jgi:hypothetical protein
VAIPFVLAIGFTIAAIAAMLRQHFGAVAGTWIMAAGLAGLGAVAALAVSAKEHTEEKSEEVMADAAAAGPAIPRGVMQALPGLLSVAPLMFRRASGYERVGDIALRNTPLLILAAGIALLFWPASDRRAARVSELGEADAEYLPEGGGSVAPQRNTITMQYAVRTILADQAL